MTHAPLDRRLNDAVVARMAAPGTVSVPTLAMMRAVSQLPPGSPAYRPGMDLTHAIQSVTALRAAGVRLLAGTDANTAPGTIVNVPPGRSLHDELALLVDAGLSALEALVSATSLTADTFGLNDRGGWPRAGAPTSCSSPVIPSPTSRTAARSSTCGSAAFGYRDNRPLERRSRPTN